MSGIHCWNAEDLAGCFLANMTEQRRKAKCEAVYKSQGKSGSCDPKRASTAGTWNCNCKASS